MEIHETIIQSMTLHKQMKSKSINQIRDQVKRGLEIKADDDKALEEGRIRSHYHMSPEDQDVMWIASIYGLIMWTF